MSGQQSIGQMIETFAVAGVLFMFIGAILSPLFTAFADKFWKRIMWGPTIKLLVECRSCRHPFNITVKLKRENAGMAQCPYCHTINDFRDKVAEATGKYPNEQHTAKVLPGHNGR